MKMRPEIRTTSIYILFGFLWILFSDNAMLLITNDFLFIKEISTYKGWFYVLVTGILLYYLIRRDTLKNERHTRELTKAKEKAEEADKLKSRFLATLSHELRSPMNAILGFSELINNKNIAEEKRNLYTNVIHEKTTNLLCLVNNLIESAKLQEGNYNIFKEPIYVNEFIRSIYESELNELGLSNRHNNNLLLQLDENLNLLSVNIDQTKMEQVFRNLINNALKYSCQNQIIIGNSLKNNELVCYVKDFGIGISKDLNNKIFERFVQIRDNDTLSKGGAGLGLFICKAFVEMHGGRIWVESQPNEGATFFFTVPLSISSN